ncbi:hypothetical protein D3C78_1433890 [compost metagenome]
MEDDSQRKPHPEGFGEIKAECAQRRNQDREKHGSCHAEIMGDLAGYRGGHHRRDTRHGRIHPDHGRGDAALLKDDRQERQAETDGDTHRTDGGNGGDQ